MSSTVVKSVVLKSVIYSTALIVIFVAISVVIYSIKTPSNDRNWILGEGRTASIQINDDQVRIKNFRDADWQNLDVASLKNDDALFRDLEFKLSDIQSLKAGVSHFAILSEIAHIFILFELKDGSNVVLSVEARKELGESYSFSGGLTAEFELIYLLASYRDIVGIRLKRREQVFAYPIKATPEEVQALFKVVASRTNKIAQEPEMYHLFLRNCTTEIVGLANKIADKNFSRLVQSFMPGNSGKALLEMDLIDSDTPSTDEFHKSFLIKK